MARQKQQEQAPAPNGSLRGTLVSVILMGVFIILVWVGVYALFTARIG